MFRKVKLIFIIPRLFGGGSERVFSNLLKHFDKTKFDITVILFAGKPDFEIDNVKFIELNVTRLRFAVWPILSFIRNEKPDMVFSTLGYVNVFLCVLRWFFPKKTKLVVRESNLPSRKHKEKKCPWLFNTFYRFFYPKADLIICQSDDMVEDLQVNYKIPKNHLVKILNPIDIDSVKIQAKQESHIVQQLDQSRFNMVIVSKLESQKGIDLAIEALNHINIENYHLTIVGEGQCKKKLLQLTEQNNLSKHISFVGFQSNPYPIIQFADVLLLSSRYEGLPNVLLEAGACNTPVVAFACPGGITEIIENGRNGWLADENTPDGLADALNKSYKYQKYKYDFSNVLNKFNMSLIIKQYESIFLNLVSRFRDG